MPTPSSNPLWFCSATRRVGVWIGLACCAALAGCAGKNESSSLNAHLDARKYDKGLSQPDYREGRDPINDVLLGRYPFPQREAKVQLADTAMTFLGVRYRWGGNDPQTGFDCSGLVVYAARQSLGLKLPRRTADLAAQGKAVKRNDLQAGDLVFFNTLGRRFSHVGIYVGDNRFVHAPSSGGVVRVESLDTSYWAKRYTGARRLDVTKLSSASPGS